MASARCLRGRLTEAQLEALLFVAEKPLSRGEIARLAGVDRETVDDRLGDLEVTLADRGIRLVLGGDRVELTTAPEAGALIARYVGADAVRLSPAALETLAIVAYRQPVTKAVIERIRGVDSDYTVQRSSTGGSSWSRVARTRRGGRSCTGRARVPRAVRDHEPGRASGARPRRRHAPRRRDQGGGAATKRSSTRPAARPTRSTRTPDLVPADRISKVLAAAGVASRRGADELVAAGRVTVDGRPAVLGEKVDPEVQRVAVDGREIDAAPAGHIYLALHKPAGVASTVRDRHAPWTVLDLVPAELSRGARLYPVGRLDQDLEGLILLTNDGEWAERVLHPRYGMEREYAVALGGPLTREQARWLESGVELAEGVATVGQLRGQTHTEDRRLADILEPEPDPASAGSASPSTRAGSASCDACSARSAPRSAASSGSGSGRSGLTRWRRATCGR